MVKAATKMKEDAGEFALETGVALPAIKRGGGASRYPFDQMAAPHVNEKTGEIEYSSFHVAATKERPKPVKSLASTVSGATARYSKPDASGATRVNKSGKKVPVMVKEREFVVRSVGDEDPKGPGARVFRIK